MADSLLDRMSREGASTPTEELLFRYFQERYPQLAFDKIEDVCHAAGVSTASVTRYVRKLGYRGYRDFSRSLRDEVSANFDSPAERAVSTVDPASPGAIWHRHAEAAGVELSLSLPAESSEKFAEIVALLRDHERPVYLLSHASGKHLLAYFRLLASYHRPRLHLLGALDEIPHNLVGAPANSVLLVTAFDRHSTIVRATMAYAREKGFTVALITNRPATPLRQWADIVLHIPSTSAGRFRSRVPLIVLLEALIDSLESESSTERGEEMEELFGALGTIITPRAP